MTNINTRDGLENLRTVSKRFRSCFRNDKKPEKDRKGSKTMGGLFLIPTKTLKTESRRFWEYRNTAILDEIYRNTAWKIVQYRNTANPNVPLYKPTKKSKYMYSLLVYKKKTTQTIQYTRTINGTASLVEAISSIQKEFKSTGHYKIQSVTCSCANVDRSETKEMMKNQRQRLISRPKGQQSTQ